MNLEEIKQHIKSHRVEESVEYFLYRDVIPVFNNGHEYEQYKQLVKQAHPDADLIIIGGSGNWGYSFNPTKLFRPFSQDSDIDLVIVSKNDFLHSWEKLRKYHRENWYRIGPANQSALRRSGENVYSGFVTLKWIPDMFSPHRIEYEELVNGYSIKPVGFRDVNLMYFKNRVELVDYYKRSFLLVRRS